MLHLVWTRILGSVKILIHIANFTGCNLVKLVTEACKKPVLIETGPDAGVGIVEINKYLILQNKKRLRRYKRHRNRPLKKLPETVSDIRTARDIKEALFRTGTCHN